MAPQELRRRAEHFRHLARVLSDEKAIAAALVLSSEYEEEALEILQYRVECAEQLIAHQIARIQKLDRSGLTSASIVARRLLETFETSLDLTRSSLRIEQGILERAVADLG